MNPTITQQTIDEGLSKQERDRNGARRMRARSVTERDTTTHNYLPFFVVAFFVLAGLAVYLSRG